jgi:hypothetical protein
MYLTLKSLSAEDSLKGRKLKAKLEGNGSAKFTLTITAKSKDALKEVLKTLKKGSVFEINLDPVGHLNESLDEFFEEEV